MSRVSVIIAAYNAEAFIGEALGSVFAQTYEDWEVILADDCSTDRTAEIARGFGERVRVERTPSNSGPAVARNLAASHAAGELLVPLDADDYWLPEFLEQQIRLYDASRRGDATVGIVACDAQLLGPDGSLSELTYLNLAPFPAELTLTALLVSNPIFVSAVIPRRLFIEVGGECADAAPAEDWDLWIRVMERGHRAVVNRNALAVYRFTPGSLSSDAVVLARAVQRVYTRALDRGNLTARQRRIVRRERRLQRAVELIHELGRRRKESGGGQFVAVGRALPTVALSVAEHPRRWPSYLRMLRRARRTSAFVRQVGQ